MSPAPTPQPQDGPAGCARWVSTRRRALVGAGTLIGATTVLAACGSDAPEDSSGAAELAEPVDIAAVDEVPVGGVLRASAGGVTAMITQPEEGRFKAFSSACTHQGCTLNAQKDREIVCPCHSSKFDLNDGAVLGGPAEDPLPEYPVTVKDGRILIGG